ncbi:MAG: cation:proton antiporter [Pseudomonadota bacterium]
MNLIIALAAAFVLGRIAIILKLPAIIGFLGAGFLLNIFHQSIPDGLKNLSDFGVTLLLFGVGLHFRFKDMLQLKVLIPGSLQIALCATLFILASSLLNISLSQAWILGLLLSLSSTVLSAKILGDRHELGSTHGRLAIGILILQDFIAIAILHYLEGNSFDKKVFFIFLLPLLRPLLYNLLSRTEQAELLLLFTVTYIFAISKGFEWMGLSHELGAVAAGFLIGSHPRADRFNEQIWGFKEIGLIGFFLYAGWMSNINAETLLYSILALIILPLKAGVFFWLFRLVKIRPRIALVAAASLTSYSEFMLIAGQKAHEKGLINESALGALALITIISYAIGAIILRLAHRFPLSENGTVPPHIINAFFKIEYLVIGLGRSGQAALKTMMKSSPFVLGIDSDPVVIEKIKNNEINTLLMDSQDAEIWEALPPQEFHKLRGIVLAIPNIDARIITLNYLKKHHFKGVIITYAFDEEEYQTLRQFENIEILLMFTEAGERLGEFCVEKTQR